VEAIEQRRWRIGELARETGVTVRALRHYDDQGLLQPTERSEAGYRLYAEEDVRRLYRLVALRRLGLSLDQVAAVLEGEREDLEETLRHQLGCIERELSLLSELRHRVADVLDALHERHEAPADQLIDVIEVMTMEITLDRIYTGTGDDGHTDLGRVGRVSKVDARVEAGGAIDELNSHLGLAAAHLEAEHPAAAVLAQVQHDLFDAGALLLTPERVEWLEERCDEYNTQLAPLSSFLLPGGSPAAAQLHVCRTVCRRAERRVLAAEEPKGSEVVRYLNRLSDLLFILARAANTSPEQHWKPGGRP
jgi:cob(I)alamin adenosyltransferase